MINNNSVLFAAVAILTIAGATSCKKEAITVTTDAENTDIVENPIELFIEEMSPSLATKASAEEIVLRPIDDVPGAPYLIITKIPLSSHTAPAVKGVAYRNEDITSFTVDAVIEGQSDKFIDGAVARHETDTWTLTDSQGKNYGWPDGEDAGKNVAFWAHFQELDDIEGAFKVTSVSDDKLTFNYAYETNLEQPYTKDLIFAYKKQSSGAIGLNFSHALAAIGAFISDSQDPFIKILSCDFEGIASCGTCECGISEQGGIVYSWDASKKGHYKASFGEGKDKISAENFHFVQPQTLDTDAKLTVIVDNMGISETHSFSLKGMKWDAGYKYVYRLSDAHQLDAVLPSGAFFWADSNKLMQAVSHTLNPLDDYLIDELVFKTRTPLSDYEIYSDKSDFTARGGSGVSCQYVFSAQSKFLHVITLSNNIYSNASMSMMFKGSNGSDYAIGMPYFYVRRIDVSSLNTSRTTSMSETFESCGNMTELKLSDKFTTESVTSMSKMFFQCYSIPSLDLRYFNTVNVTDMSQMFYNCYKLETLILGEDFVVAGTKTDMMLNCGQDVDSPVVYCTDATWSALSDGTGISSKWIHKGLDEAPAFNQGN